MKKPGVCHFLFIIWPAMQLLPNPTTETKPVGVNPQSPRNRPGPASLALARTQLSHCICWHQSPGDRHWLDWIPKRTRQIGHRAWDDPRRQFRS
jgi:hypothetical protein